MAEDRTQFAEEKTRIELPRMRLFDNPAFRYTTPSASKELSPKERRSKGCIERTRTRYCFESEAAGGGKPKKNCFSTRHEAERQAKGAKLFTKQDKKFTGKRCTSKLRNGTCKPEDETYDPDCKGSNDPCASDRSTCPVQLVWVNGRPNLRFCKTKKKPGYLVPVKSVSEAMRISDEACKKWPYQLSAQSVGSGEESEAWDETFFERNAPEIPEAARAAYPASGGLGGVRARARRGGLGWFLAALAAGVGVGMVLRRPAQGATTQTVYTTTVGPVQRS